MQIPKNNKTLKIPVETYSRVVGYFRPVDQWNPGKQEEFKTRTTYEINSSEIMDYVFPKKIKEIKE